MERGRQFIKSKFLKIILVMTGIILLSASKGFAAGPIIINEIMYDLKGADTGREWIEIKNISSDAVDLTNWRFNDGDNHLLQAPPKNGGQGSLIIPPGGFAVFADKADIFLSEHPGFSGIVIDTTMSLGQQADRIYVLKILNSEGATIDEVDYNINLGANGNGFSLERVNDNSLQFCESKNENGSPGAPNNFDCAKAVNSLAPTPIPTPMPMPMPISSLSNSPTPTTNFLPENSTSDNLKNTPSITPLVTPMVVRIYITEFVPNPSGSDTENEWIELYNDSDVDVDLNGWRIEDASGQKYVFKDEKFLKKDYLVLARAKTKISLNNDGETLYLYSPGNEMAFKVFYSGKAPEGMAFARFKENDWRWTSVLTPGAVNQFSDEGNNQKKDTANLAIESKIEGGGKENEELSLNATTNATTTSDFKSISFNQASDKIVLAAVGLGLVTSIASAIFIKKILP